MIDVQRRAKDFFQIGQNQKIGGAEKKIGGAESRPKGAKKFSVPPYFFSAPPAEFDSAPGAEQTTGGQKTLLYLEKEGETFNNRSLSKPQLTVLFFMSAMHFLIG